MLGIRPPDPVGQLVNIPVATVRPDATLRDAAQVLTTEGIGLLVVVDPGGVRGVLSERDIVRAAAEGADLDEERVRDHTIEELVTVDESDSVLDAATAMMAAEVRHLAVARHGEVMGVVSLRDLAAVLIGAASLVDQPVS